MGVHCGKMTHFTLFVFAIHIVKLLKIFTVAIVYSRSPEPRKLLWFTRLRKCASLLQLPSYLRVMECVGVWARSELCIRARIRVDLLSTLALRCLCRRLVHTKILPDLHSLRFLELFLWR